MNEKLLKGLRTGFNNTETLIVSAAYVNSLFFEAAEELERLYKLQDKDPVAYITYKGHLLHASDPRVAEHSDPTPLYDAPPDCSARIKELEKQRDELLAALEKQQLDTLCECKNCMNAHAAIASAKGAAE